MDDSVGTSITVIFQPESQFQHLEFFLVLSVREIFCRFMCVMQFFEVLKEFFVSQAIIISEKQEFKKYDDIGN